MNAYEITKEKKNWLIAGVDEAGRGPLAGPVTAACVVLPQGYENKMVQDSKKLSSKLRQELCREIKEVAVAYAVVSVGHRRIDQINIREATRLAMGLASGKVQAQLKRSIHFLVDGNTEMRSKLSQQTIIKGDSLVPSISAASILAKETRDALMLELDIRYPGYGLAGHKGYPTKKHKEAIGQIGPSRIHRRTFAGVKEWLP